VRTLLVLAEHPELAESIRAALNPGEFRVVHRLSLEEAEPLLVHGLVHACVLDMDAVGAQAIWMIEKIHRRLARLPLIIYSSQKTWEWEEEAYLKGVSHILNKPVRPRMLSTVLARLWNSAAPAVVAKSNALVADASVNVGENNPRAVNAHQTWEVLRDFSAILTHSLDADAMLLQFLLMLREILGVNRAAIFLRPAVTTFGSTAEEGRRLRSASAVGLQAGLLDHLELSLEVGIGGQLLRSGRILRRNSDDARTDVETQKEFELLGVQVAIPVLDRENLIGVAVFDGRVTGEPLTNNELELIFHLLEQLGLAIKNIRLHDQISANNDMMGDVLRELSSACVVVSRDLGILHANKAARRLFGQRGQRSGDLEFTDLPQLLGGKVYQVLKTGTAVDTFRFEPATDVRKRIFSINVLPFQRQGSALPNAALLVVEDLTQSEALRKLELEAENLRLVRNMADRIAHEVGNALVPLSTHQQLLADRYQDPEFRASLDIALADGVKRISRLINQMRYLAREGVVSTENFPLTKVIQEAYEEAQKYCPSKNTKLKCDDGGKPLFLTGDRTALRHALAEVILNALQANPAKPEIAVRMVEAAVKDVAGLSIEITDNGAGFAPETVKQATEPFFTTRNVGLGLGLTVTQKILATHSGTMEIIPATDGHTGLVRLSLPLEQSQEPQFQRSETLGKPLAK
jgi:signal transduction histidine kinase